MTSAVDNPCCRKERGSALIITLFFLLGISMIVVSVITLAASSNRVAERGAQKVQATALAEAAIHAHYDAIKKSLAADGTFSTSLAPTTLYSTVSGVRLADGVYSSSVVGTPGRIDLDVLNALNIKVGLKTSYVFVLEGEGIASDGRTRSRVRASFTAEQIRATVATTPVSAFSANAAIQSNAGVQMITNGGMRTYSTTNNSNAGIIANGTVSWTPYSGSKSSFTNNNAVDIDGQIMVPGSPDPNYAATVGASGMGNSNGSVNYKTKAVAAQNGNPAAAANTIMGLSGAKTFADEGQVTTWQQQWISSAQSGTQFTGSVSTSSAPTNLLTGEKRITAPAYINGDLNASSGQLYLQPNLDTSKPQVIYVKGNITNGALLYNRGVVLICEGKYSTTNSSALYGLQTQYSLFTSMTSLYKNAALVSLSKSADAIKLGSNSSAPAGLIYAAQGGMVVPGQNEIKGVLVAGGVGANGGIVISPQNGNSFVVHYQPEAIDRTDFSISSNSINLGAVLSTTPSRLTGWVQVK
jgi:hypothetical protein